MKKFDVRMKTHLSERSFFGRKMAKSCKQFSYFFLGHKLHRVLVVEQHKVKIHFGFYKFYVAMTLNLLVHSQRRRESIY